MIKGFFKDMMEHRFPLVPGLDLGGVVDAVGPGVEGIPSLPVVGSTSRLDTGRNLRGPFRPRQGQPVHDRDGERRREPVASARSFVYPE